MRTETELDSRPLPPNGKYPVPGHHRDEVVLRDWDGDVWTDEVQPAPEGSRLAGYHRRIFASLTEGGWQWVLAFLALLGVASAFWAIDIHAEKVHGIQILALPFSALATVVLMWALIERLFGRRVGFHRISTETRKSILIWGIVAGLVGVAFGITIELFVPRLFGSSTSADGWNALTGPAEETGKLLIPVVLWFRGRFRLPREGYLLVLISAATFGVFESTEYIASPEGWQPPRPFIELLHPLLTGFVAAVAWQAAWKGKSFFTGAAIGAWVIAMVAHSTNDLIVLDKNPSEIVSDMSSFITVAVLVLMYLLQKHSARQMVPPDTVEKVAPRWRPVAPRRH